MGLRPASSTTPRVWAHLLWRASPHKLSWSALVLIAQRREWRLIHQLDFCTDPSTLDSMTPLLHLTPTQLRRAADVKERIDSLQIELFVTAVLRTSWLEATSDGQSATRARKAGNEKLFVML